MMGFLSVPLNVATAQEGGEFDIKAYDLEGRLFDQVTLRK